MESSARCWFDRVGSQSFERCCPCSVTDWGRLGRSTSRSSHTISGRLPATERSPVENWHSPVDRACRRPFDHCAVPHSKSRSARAVLRRSMSGRCTNFSVSPVLARIAEPSARIARELKGRPSSLRSGGAVCEFRCPTHEVTSLGVGAHGLRAHGFGL